MQLLMRVCPPVIEQVCPSLTRLTQQSRVLDPLKLSHPAYAMLLSDPVHCCLAVPVFSFKEN